MGGWWCQIAQYSVCVLSTPRWCVAVRCPPVQTGQTSLAQLPTQPELVPRDHMTVSRNTNSLTEHNNSILLAINLVLHGHHMCHTLQLKIINKHTKTIYSHVNICLLYNKLHMSNLSAQDIHVNNWFRFNVKINYFLTGSAMPRVWEQTSLLFGPCCM